MAVYSGNDIYLTMNEVDVTARWRSFEMSLNVDEEDTSAGAGIDWKSRAAKLGEVQGTIMLVYDDTQAATDMAALYQADQIIAIDYGPEGNAAGKPRHAGNFFISSISGPSTNHDKTLVTLEFSVTSTGTPTANIYAGDTF